MGPVVQRKASELPEGWVMCYSRRYDTLYYFNTLTDVSQWVPPARVAIIIPFRDIHVEQNRQAHLDRFVPFMTNFMEKQGVDFHIYVIEQSDDGRKFNRGKLLNIGFKMAVADGRTVFVLHDVDLLPSDELGFWYATEPPKPVHVAGVWDRYAANNANYFGGVVVFNKEDFEKINGYPNNFWGWGGEDDEMYRRLRATGMDFERPPAGSGSLEDLEKMDLQTKLGFLREHRDWKFMLKQEALETHEATWRQNGLANLDYEELAQQQLNDYATKFTVDVKENHDWLDSAVSVEQQKAALANAPPPAKRQR